MIKLKYKYFFFHKVATWNQNDYDLRPPLYGIAASLIFTTYTFKLTLSSTYLQMGTHAHLRSFNYTYFQYISLLNFTRHDRDTSQCVGNQILK